MKYHKSRLSKVMPILRVLNSSMFFWVIVGFLVVQATWIALSGLYPMAFDEDFHFGIIKLYAHHISPFWNSQPEAANTFGAVYRDPSYLYHYLMSFPYRLISLLTSNQTIQIVLLRFINIGLFASGLVIFKKVLTYIKASEALTNATLLIFILIPVIPQLAAQINYDNLFFPLTGLVFLLTLKLSDTLKSDKKISIEVLLSLASLALLTSLVKYAFLPILLAVTIFSLIRIKQTFMTWRDLKRAISDAWKSKPAVRNWAMVFGLLLSIGLFSQRYVVNTYLYHTPIPDCSKVLDVEACSDYGPWIRDHNLKQAKTNLTYSPVLFTSNWAYGMWFRLFFALDGPSTQYETRGALLFPAVISVSVITAGIVLTLIYFKNIWRKYDKYAISFFMVVSAIYISVLWVDQFEAFRSTGQLVAVNGRYLLPVLLPLMLLTGLAFGQLFKNNTKAKSIAISVTILCMFWGGGAMTYIIRSNDDASWWWPNSFSRNMNHAVKAVLHPVMPGFYDWGRFWR